MYQIFIINILKENHVFWLDINSLSFLQVFQGLCKRRIASLGYRTQTGVFVPRTANPNPNISRMCFGKVTLPHKMRHEKAQIHFGRGKKENQ